MLKHILYTIISVITITSCGSNQMEHADSENSDSNIMTTENGEVEDIYEKDWEILKHAIVTKNEAVVLTFVSNEDAVLKEAIDISYEFIFDDEVIEKIKNLNFHELDQPGICGTQDNGEEIHFDNRFISIHKEVENDSTGVLTESSLEIELLKTENGLKIINYKTLYQEYDTE